MATIPTTTTIPTIGSTPFDPNLFIKLLYNTVDGGKTFIKGLWGIIQNIQINPFNVNINKWRNKMMYEYGQDNNMDTVIDVVIQKLNSQDKKDLSDLEMLVHIVNKRKIFNEVDEFLSQIINHNPPLIQELYKPAYKNEPLGSVYYSVHKNQIRENNRFNNLYKENDYEKRIENNQDPYKTGVSNLVRVQLPYKTVYEQMKDVENLFKSIDMEHEQGKDTKETVHRDSIRIKNDLEYRKEADKTKPVAK